MSSDYDSEPVLYCSRCYSLNIRYEETIGLDCCADCGCSDILESSIEEWEKLYERRYGHKLIVKSDDPKDSYIFKLSISQLKDFMFDNPEWRYYIKEMYPSFPGGLGKGDSIILFFDKLIKDNRLDDLRLLILEHKK